MYLVRDVFKAKPGKAKDLVNKFKNTMPFFPTEGFGKPRILTDVVAGYWTVVLEIEVENLSLFENMNGFTSRPEVKEIMKDYMDLVEGGNREIFRIE